MFRIECAPRRCEQPYPPADICTDFLEYEARLNEVVPEGRDTVVCLYDLSKSSAALIADVLRTHPVVILGGLLHENPFYPPVDQFLHELHGRRHAQGAAR